MIAALLFYFVAACNPDGDQCPSIWEWSPAEYVVEGPFFDVDECRGARLALPYAYAAADEERPRAANPWLERGESECYAREVRVQ